MSLGDIEDILLPWKQSNVHKINVDSLILQPWKNQAGHLMQYNANKYAIVNRNLFMHVAHHDQWKSVNYDIRAICQVRIVIAINNNTAHSECIFDF